MKYFIRIENEAGKVDGMGGNEYLDIDITAGNKVIARLTVRENEHGTAAVYDEHDRDISTRRVPVVCKCKNEKQKQTGECEHYGGCHGVNHDWRCNLKK